MTEFLIGFLVILFVLSVIWYIGKLYREQTGLYHGSSWYWSDIISDIGNGMLVLLFIAFILFVIGLLTYMCYKLGFLILH